MLSSQRFAAAQPATLRLIKKVDPDSDLGRALRMLETVRQLPITAHLRMIARVGARYAPALVTLSEA